MSQYHASAQSLMVLHQPLLGHTSISVIWLSRCCPVCSFKIPRVVPQMPLAWQVVASCKGWDTWSRLTVPAWNTTYSNKLHANMQPHHNFTSQVNPKQLSSRPSHLKVQADEVQAAPLWRGTRDIYPALQKKAARCFLCWDIEQRTGV